MIESENEREETHKQCFNNASTELRRENRRREEQMTVAYKEALENTKKVLKEDPVFKSIRTKQEKYRYSKDHYDELVKNYKAVATKVSFREMIDDAIFELEKEKRKI